MKSDNRLVFNVYDYDDVVVMNVKCIEGEGLTIFIHETYEDFAENYESVAKNVFELLNGLHDVFKINGNVQRNMDVILSTLHFISDEPFNLKIEYLEDTLYGKAKNKKEVKDEYDYMDEILNSFLMNPYMGGVNRESGNELLPVGSDEYMENMFGSFGSPKKKEEKKEDKPKRTTITFNDVVGMEEVKDKLQDVIRQFKQAEKYKAWNIKPIRGILFYGPSGTGKSYIAEAFANEIDAVFYPLSTADIMSKYLGESGKAIRAKFEEARKHPLSIIYIDEVDAIAAKRDGSENSKERNATLNELLVQMASPENDNILMLFATNMLDLLDPAFLRSGRCDFKLEVSLPDYD